MTAIDAEDRTADLTISVSSDANVLLSTHKILVNIDTFSEAIVIDRMRGLLLDEITNASAIPLTQAQLDDMILGLQVVVPG